MDLSEQIERFEREYWQLQTENSKIVPFFSGKNVLVTGVTGFIGKVLLEKLLRANEHLGKVFLIVRAKKGQNETSRIAKLCSEMIFNPLRKIQPDFEKKIVILKGDISLPDLGLSAEDVNTITEEVNMIYHVGATVKFNEHLRIATFTNVRSTRDLLNIASRCRYLDAFAHVSTAFSNCVRKEIDERFYDTPYDVSRLIEMAEKGEVTTENSSEIMGKWPNSYVFTKAVAENAVEKWKGRLPICIVRPAIVLATYKEPIRSWIDNINGIMGIMVGGATGLLKTVPCDGEIAAEVVPVDYTINALIVASYQTANEKPTDIPIYNYVCSPENRITWHRMFHLTEVYGHSIPSVRSIWYHCLMLNPNKYVHRLYVIFVHYLPAILMDTGMLITGQKPIMTKMYKKIDRLLELITYFSCKEWNFANKNVQNLWNGLPEADRGVFPFSMSDLDWDDYQSTHVLGLRLFLAKDDLETVPEARKRQKWFYVAHLTLKYGFRLLLLYFAIYIIVYAVMNIM